MMLPVDISSTERVARVLRDPQGFASRRRKHVGEPFTRTDINPWQLFRPHRSERDSSLIRTRIGNEDTLRHAKEVDDAVAIVDFEAGSARSIRYKGIQALDVVDDRVTFLGHANLTLPCIDADGFPAEGETMSDDLRDKLRSIYIDLFHYCDDPVLI
jgi:hypothetical protein